ncbi:unnamed protein product [Polarella glacialis]|uniref:Uncharacterized protein n=1 Tax=Polarella glacialis TaxID=89957 RepID=A0A813FSY9_POLGL|nr:unnamed protein product [Polarella glacialis]
MASCRRFSQLPSRYSKGQVPLLGSSESGDRPLGSHQARRTLLLENAAARGDVEWLQALLEAGVEVDATNVFGQSALFVAAWRGHAKAVALLAHFGADPTLPANGGCTPWRAAAAQGHRAVLRVLGGTELSGDQGVPCTGNPAASETTEGQLQAQLLIPDSVPHPGAGSWLLECCVEENFLRRLDMLGQALPVPAMEVHRRAAQRLFACDAEGWIVAQMQEVIRAAGYAEVSVSPWLRFLRYKEAGARLASHVDYQWLPGYESSAFPGYAPSGGDTTHSFLLFDCS